MIKRLLFLLLVIAAIKPMVAQTNSYDSILVNSDWRTFRVHLPKGYTASKTYPLVLALHGGGGSAAQFALSSELTVKADSAGFIVVFPEGKKNPGALGARSWNAGYCCATNSTAGTDDVGFLSKLIDKLLGGFSIDTSRVYATGHSNGGMMCYRLATELSDRITAVAISSATMVRNYPFTPKRPVPVIHFHSYKDQNVPYYGGEITGVVPPVHSPPVDSIIRIWSTFDECAVKDDTVHKGTTYNEIVFKNGKCQSQINLYVTYDGGHAWPGGNPGGGPDSDTPSIAINANYLLWNFFQQYHLECLPVTGIEKIKEEEAFFVFPNPLDQWNTDLHVNLPVGTYEVKIVGLLGEVKRLGNYTNVLNVDCADLPAGIYLLEIQSGEQYFSKKFVKR